MKHVMTRNAIWALLAAQLVCAGPAQAQMSSLLQGAAGSGGGSTGSGMGSGMGSMMGGGMGSGLGGAALPSLQSTPPTNLAGVLQYCVQNNYLGGNDASASGVKQSLLQKFTGSAQDPSSDSGFTSGSNGMLQTGGGNSMSLGGSGLKAQMTQKLCSQVLKHSQSLL